MQERSSWGFGEGDEIVPGRHATRLLGGGRRYEAYLAWDEELHALVVVKIVRPDVVDSAPARRGIDNEARALAALVHPTIVRMFDAVLDGERPHLVLEHLDGPRLSTLVRRYRILLEHLLPLAFELCSALQFMHRRRFLHLDVKPRNIVMSNRPRLIDLSLATPVDSVPSITRPIGTDAYMAPEQCDPERYAEIGPPSDIWGLGVTMYEALTRERPFSTGGGVVRYPQLVSDPYPLPRDFPRPLGDAVLSCLEARPNDRPTALELSRSLEPWVATLRAPRVGALRPAAGLSASRTLPHAMREFSAAPHRSLTGADYS